MAGTVATAQNTTIYFKSSSESTTISSQFNLICNIESDERHIFYDRIYIRRNNLTICRYDHVAISFMCDDEIYVGYFSIYNRNYICGCVNVNRYNTIFNLTINGTSKEDNGTWGCDTMSINKTLSVIVKYPPSINNITLEPNKGEIKEGIDVKLSCLVDSFPKSNITWSVNGVEKMNRGSDFVIPKAKCEDSGKYTCWAENGIRSKASKTEQVDVNCSPRINLKEKPTTLILASSTDSVNLTATVMAYPVPNFTWKYLLEDKSEKPITDWRMKIKSDKLTSYLNILNITEQDFGNYIMYAKNKEGEISFVFTLKEDPDTVRQDGSSGDNDNKLGTGIGIGFIVGLLVMGVIVVIVFFIWKIRGETGINVRQLILKYKKRSPIKETGTTETAPSTRPTSSSRRCTTVESDDKTYEGLDMENSPKQTYEEINIYENQSAVA
ncbi:hypothetical protein LOTGIDRAFT_155380 [Lottia gigantea]|uniref:Ig-like domain-containing protein n=1 Tax=Lottia gigantea TaxID=225164 RepID=V3ZNL3_LOTGI|nr:hypothetical protein LOTGIDRAFT_155380 [Lottia gigantea]ESO84065.1 hypothetical protein LOTGIDRAFT_155380 [Lottia gigantea]